MPDSARITDPDGRLLGNGYVELTGYGTAAPPIIWASGVAGIRGW